MRKTYFLLIVVFLFSSNHKAFCWPTVFATGVTIHKPEKAYQGYNLYVTMGKNEPIKLIDMEGNIITTWETGPFYVYLPKPLPDGKIMFIAQIHLLFVVDWNGSILWAYKNEEFHLHHDCQLLSNGNMLILARKKVRLKKMKRR